MEKRGLIPVRATALAILMLAIFTPVLRAGSPAQCSICGTDCLSEYRDQLEDCGLRLFCHDGASAEKNACIGNCVHDLGCDDYDWWNRGVGYNPGGGDPGDDPFSLLY